MANAVSPELKDGLLAVSATSQTGRLQAWPLFGGTIVLYTVGLGLSWLVSGSELAKISGMGSAVLVFWLLYLLGQRLYWLYLAGLGLVLALSLVGVLALGQLDDDYLRVNSLSERVIEAVKRLGPNLEGLAMHRNTLAGMLAVFATLALAYMFFGQRWWERIGAGLAGLFMLGALVVTNSRGGLVAFAAGLVLIVALAWRDSKVKLRLVLAAGGLLLAAGAIGYLLVSGQYRLFSPERLLNENGTGRVEIWKNTLYALGDVPLSGFGPGRFEAVYPFYLDPVSLSLLNSQEHSHNLFLQTYVEAGLLGLVAMLWVALVWGLELGRTLRSKRAETEMTPNLSQIRNVLLHGGLAAFGALLVYGVAEHSTWHSQFAFLFWVPLALVASASSTRPLKFWSGKWSGLQSQLSTHRRRNGLALLLLAIVTLVASWQLWGLGQVNAASLEILKGWPANNSASLEQANQFYSNAATISGWTGVPARGQAWVALQQNNLTEASSYLKQRLAYDPKDRRSLLLLADLLSSQGQQAQALKLWQDAVAAPLYVARGRRLLDSPEDSRAEPYLLRATQIDPRLWDGYQFLVMLYQRHGRTSESIALLEKATSFFPNDPRPGQELNKLGK